MSNTEINKSGFTIVELVTVIAVIGILAAITIVSYRGIQNRASDSAVESDLASIAKKLEIHKSFNGGGRLYPVHSSSTVLAEVGFSASKSAYKIDRASNYYYCASPDYTSYAVGAVSKSGQNYYMYNGKIEKAGGVWSSTTCERAGHPASPAPAVYSAAGYIDTSGWAGWVK